MTATDLATAQAQVRDLRRTQRQLRAELAEANRQRDEALAALRHATQELRRHLAAEAMA